ncbi:MAG: hypothetical protein J0H40_17740 [Rhizobiales bacterium]|nr:hypothetical protein [Hyphomicrobiales bacterium]
MTVASPAADTALVTLDRVKLELGLTGTDANRDTVLQAKIDEASEDIEAALGFRVVRETAVETFWHEQYDSVPDRLALDRIPIASIASVVVDGGDPLSNSLYRFDPKTGELFALDTGGYPIPWFFCKSVVVTYDGGYILPGASNSDLPAAIEGACIDLVSSYWSAKGRDPTVKSEEIPGVISTQYWVGAVGEDGELPPSVVTKLARWRRTGQA